MNSLGVCLVTVHSLRYGRLDRSAVACASRQAASKSKYHPQVSMICQFMPFYKLIYSYFTTIHNNAEGGCGKGEGDPDLSLIPQKAHLALEEGIR